jgi:CheY-like chemotaxis protein
MSAAEHHRGAILVADDNESNRELLCSLLTEEGYQSFFYVVGANLTSQHWPT